MNSQVPPWDWQEPIMADGNAAATAFTIAESFGRGLRVSPGPTGERGPAHAVVPPPPPTENTGAGRDGDMNSAQFDQGPTSLPRRARARQEYIVSNSRSNGIRCAPKFSDSPTVCS